MSKDAKGRDRQREEIIRLRKKVAELLRENAELRKRLSS